MMTWMEMVGLPRFVLYLSSCPCSLLGTGIEVLPRRAFPLWVVPRSLRLGGPKVHLCLWKKTPQPTPWYLTTWVFLELYITARNFVGNTLIGVLSGLCLCRAAIFQIIPFPTATILFMHESPGSGELNEWALSRVTGCSAWVRLLLQRIRYFSGDMAIPSLFQGPLWRQSSYTAQLQPPLKGPCIVICVNGTLWSTVLVLEPHRT